jgi:E3 ubiquitin-protein ligase listerin
LNEISISVISKALVIDQSGSVWDYTKALLALTSVSPAVWTGAYTDKRLASDHLRQFLKKGSQGGPPEFWDNIGNLFQSIPREVLPQDAPLASKLLGAYNDGINSSQEPKSNARSAWTNYFAVAARLLSLLPESETRRTLLEQSLFPIFEKCLRQTDEGALCPSIQAPEVCAEGFKVLAQLRFSDIQDLLVLEWRRLAGHLMEDMRKSLPEQSESFKKSQESLIQEAKRWFSMQGILLREPGPPFSFEVCIETSVCILKVAVEILNSRNGLFGAALWIH